MTGDQSISNFIIRIESLLGELEGGKKGTGFVGLLQNRQEMLKASYAESLTSSKYDSEELSKELIRNSRAISAALKFKHDLTHSLTSNPMMSLTIFKQVISRNAASNPENSLLKVFWQKSNSFIEEKIFGHRTRQKVTIDTLRDAASVKP